MLKSNSTKKAFLLSLGTLLLSCVMLMTTTLAWFTDNISSKNNRILSGDLEIDLLMHKESKYLSISDGSGDIFEEHNGGEVLWEPGKTEIVFIAVKNIGTLALKYDFKLNITDEGLVGALDYAILDDVSANDFDSENWNDIKTHPDARVGKLTAGTIDISKGNRLNKSKDADYYAIAVHMHDNASQSFQGGKIKVDLAILATQAPYEKDSFGKDYDESAMIDKTKESVKVTKTNINSVDLTKDNMVYKFSGEFDNIIIQTNEGLNQTFDGSGIVGTPDVIIKTSGMVNSYEFAGKKISGTYTVTGFNAVKLIVYGFDAKFRMVENNCEFMYVCGGNVDLDIIRNGIDSKSTTHTLGENNIETDCDYGVYLKVTDYNLKFNENTLINTIGHAVVINGRQTEEGFETGGAGNIISAFSGNNITLGDDAAEGSAALAIYDCPKYAPPESVKLSDDAREFVKFVKSDNTFSIGDTKIYFDFGGVEILNIE